MTTHYTELHVYDFDSTLVKNKPYDNDGKNSRWLTYILNDVVKSYVRKNPEKFKDIDYHKFELGEIVQDLDQNNRYEIIYDGESLSDDLYGLFNNKVRSLIEKGTKVEGTANPDSYYVEQDVHWYESANSILDEVITSTASSFRKSIANKNAYVIVLTGRKNIPALRKAVKTILQRHNLNPDELFMSPGGSTFKFKIGVIEDLLGRFPTINNVIMWDDRMSQIKKFDTYFANKKEIEYKMNFVKKEQLKEFISKVSKLLEDSELSESVQEVIFAVGIPGSGKSSWLKKHFGNNPDYVIISPDELRKELLGDINAQQSGGYVWKVASGQIIKNLFASKNVILDATNTVAHNRKRLISFIKETYKNPLQFSALVFEIDTNTAKARIKKDVEKGVERSNVPPEVVDRMYSQLQQSISSLQTEFDVVENI